MEIASRLHWRLLVATIAVLMAAAWIAPRFMQPPGIQENRVLAAAPAWPKGWRDLDAFRKAADAYVADHFPARPYLIGALNRLRMMAGVSGSNRVIVGRDGWLFFDNDTHLGAVRADPAMMGPEIRSWLLTYAGRTEYMQARHTPYLTVVGPLKEAIYPQYGPSWYTGPNPNRATVVLPKLAHQAGLAEILYLYPAVAEAARRGPVAYSRHDTHWNAYGAYAGYAALIGRLHEMGLTDAPHPMSDFEITKGDSGDRPRDLALMLGVAKSVKLRFPHIENPAGEAKIRKTFLGPRQDWTAPQVVDTGEVGKPTLLMTRDSFSNELLPMLLPHFSRIILSHNDDGFWRPDLIERFKPDIVVAEIVEHGLRVSLGDGPAPSAEATARIDRMLGERPASQADPIGARRPDDDAAGRTDDGHPGGRDADRELQRRDRQAVAGHWRRGHLHGVRLDVRAWPPDHLTQGYAGLKGAGRRSGGRGRHEQGAARRRGLFQEPHRRRERLRRELLHLQAAAGDLHTLGLSSRRRRLDRL